MRNLVFHDAIKICLISISFFLRCSAFDKSDPASRSDSTSTSADFSEGTFDEASGLFIIDQSAAKAVKTCGYTKATGGSPQYAYEYDSAGKLVTYKYGISSAATTVHTTFSYNSNGKLITSTTGTDVTTYSYDSSGRLASVSTPTGGSSGKIDYSYNQAGKISKVVSTVEPSGTTDYDWSNLTTTASGATSTYSLLLQQQSRDPYMAIQGEGLLPPKKIAIETKYQVATGSAKPCEATGKARLKCTSSGTTTEGLTAKIKTKWGVDDEVFLPLTSTYSDGTVLVYTYNSVGNPTKKVRNGLTVEERHYDSTGLNLESIETAESTFKCIY